MKKLIQCIAFLVGFMPLFALANPAANTLAALFGNSGSISSPADCTPGTSTFCSCWTSTIVNGCIASHTHPIAWCDNPGNIVHEVKAIGVARACSNDPTCIADFNYYIPNCSYLN